MMFPSSIQYLDQIFLGIVGDVNSDQNSDYGYDHHRDSSNCDDDALLDRLSPGLLKINIASLWSESR